MDRDQATPERALTRTEGTRPQPSSPKRGFAQMSYVNDFINRYLFLKVTLVRSGIARPCHQFAARKDIQTDNACLPAPYS